MKKSFIRPSSIACILFLIVVVFSGCFKDADDNNNIPAAGVAFIHASPKNGMLDFVDYDSYYGNILSRLPYNTSAAYPVDKENTTPYRAFYPGSRTFGVAKAGTNYFFNIQQFNLSPGKLYSVFAIDTLSKTSLFIVQDSINSIDSNKVAVKFINFSPDSDKIDFYINNSSTPIVASKAFKEGSGYIAVEPSDNSSITIKESANASVNAKRENIVLKKGSIYTVWARGLKNATDSTKLNVSILKTK